MCDYRTRWDLVYIGYRTYCMTADWTLERITRDTSHTCQDSRVSCSVSRLSRRTQRPARTETEPNSEQPVQRELTLFHTSASYTKQCEYFDISTRSNYFDLLKYSYRDVWATQKCISPAWENSMALWKTRQRSGSTPPPNASCKDAQRHGRHGHA